MSRHLDEIAKSRERAMLRAFNAAVSDIRGSATLSQITIALEDGNTDRVIALLGLDDDAVWSPMGESIRESFLIGGRTGAEQIGTVPLLETAAASAGGATGTRRPINRRIGTGGSGGSGGGGGRPFRFNMPPGGPADRIMGEFITQISEEQREMVRDRVGAALVQGRNPRNSALDLVGRIDRTTRQRTGGFIGLTRNQSQWVANARAELESLSSNYFTRQLRDRRFDAMIRRAIENGTPLDQATIDRAITRLQARTQRYRGEVIARTESINALRAGQHESVLQAMDAGGIEQQDITKRWDATLDSRTRTDHAQAERRYIDNPIPVDEPFMVGGYRLMFPGDSSGGAPASQVVQCRCRSLTRIDFIGQAAREIEGFR